MPVLFVVSLPYLKTPCWNECRCRRSSVMASLYQIISLVEQMLSLHRALPTQTDPAVRTLTTRALAATDTKIDALVYALYNLSPAEINLVEGRVPPEPDAAP